MRILSGSMRPHVRRALRSGLSSRTISGNTTTAASAAVHLLQTVANKTTVRKQLLDGNQLQKLCLTLGRQQLWPGLNIAHSAPPPGTPLPPGYHLVYFTRSDLEASLGSDGSDRGFNAPAPFTRRMWAGGRMRWLDAPLLRVGEEVEERTRLLGATAKRSRDGSEMVLVDVEKEFWGETGLAVVDRRSWIFRREVELPSFDDRTTAATPRAVVHPRSLVQDVPGASTSSFPERHLSWSPVALFRFSALTFNAHMIHYNESWTRNVEGHPGVVVHGPLNLINMMDYWRDVHGTDLLRAKEVSYRALAPIYAGDEYKISTAALQDSRYRLLVDRAGVLCMQGDVVAG